MLATFGEVTSRKKTTSVRQDDDLGSKGLDQAKAALEEAINQHGAEKVAKKLQRSLVFQQDDIKGYCAGLQSLRALFESVIHSKNKNESTKLIITSQSLVELLNPSVADPSDEEYFGQIIQPWHLALKGNNDHLLSFIAFTIVLLLRAFDSVSCFRQQGIRLCKTLLRKRETKLLSTCLALPRGKAQIISLHTQILTELVSFDAGAVAWLVFAQRDNLLDYRTLTRNLRLKEPHAASPFSKNASRSVRSDACLYILASLRFQSTSAKIYILKLRSLVQAFFDGIESDSADLVKEILYVTKTCVMLDTSLSKYDKGVIWTVSTLKSVVNVLHNHKKEAETETEHEEKQKLALELIIWVCKVPEAGLLVAGTSWHSPEGHIFEELIKEDTDPLRLIEVELYSLDRNADSTRKVAIKNRILGEFIMYLRPYAKAEDCRILLETFMAAPELIAYYFYRKSIFTHEPKLSSTWLGYTSFIQSVAKLPICALAEDWPPPPTYLAIESILPLPFTQKNLRRCLNHSSSLVRFYATQTLVSALRKLREVRNKYLSFKSSRFSTIWKKAARQLLVVVSQRCPDMRDAIAAFKSTSPYSLIQYEAASALIDLYFEVIPQAAMIEHFDMSMILCNALQDYPNRNSLERQLRYARLHRLANLAIYSSSMNWFSKTKSMSLSPFSNLLRYSLKFKGQQNLSAISKLLTVILQEHDIFQKTTEPATFDAFKKSLSTLDFDALDKVVAFFDECCMRCVRKAIKYHDDLDEIVLASQITKRSPVSAFWAVALEQWPFVLKNNNQESIIIAEWISTCLAFCCQVGEDEQVLFAIRNAFINSTDDAECMRALQAPFSRPCSQSLEGQLNGSQENLKPELPSTRHGLDKKASSIKFPYFLPIEQEDDNNQDLGRVYEDVEQSIAAGTLGKVILCLCAEDMWKRKEALVNIRKVVYKLKSQDYPEGLQLCLLLGELEETIEQLPPRKSLPYIIGAFAKSAVIVLANPADPLYSKVNKFLNNGPSWNLSRFSSYWVDHILLSPPTEEKGYFREIKWLLRIFFDGLRTLEDLNLMKNYGSIEHILTLFNSPSSPKEVDELILGLLWRIAAIGGSDTLITRFGIVSWIISQVAISQNHRKELLLLAKRLDETCDSAKISDWSSGLCNDHLKELSVKSDEININDSI